jgi:hypothetical protein
VGATANLETKTISVAPGGEASVRIRIVNSGTVVDEFALQVLGDAASWATATPPVVSLFPGNDAIATITFRPPRTAQTRSGQIPFGVRVQSSQDPAGSVVEEGAVSVGMFADTTAELIPRNSRGSRGATHQVAVDNRGNGPLKVALSADDQDKLLEFTLRPASLVIAPGTAGFIRLHVRPRQMFWRGQPKSKAFQVLVQPEGQPPIALDGSLVQGPLLAPWMIPAGAAVVALLIAAVLAWFLLLKPAIQTAARDAVATPPAGQGSGGNQSGGSTPSASAPPTSSTTNAGNFSMRLGQSSSTSYKVPPATTLSITDIVFQDPEASPGTSHGTVSLERDGVALLVENLDNFRDLDYHFVTPITLNPGQTLSMVTNCPSGCPAVSIYVDGYQRG